MKTVLTENIIFQVIQCAYENIIKVLISVRFVGGLFLFYCFITSCINNSIYSICNNKMHGNRHSRIIVSLVTALECHE